MTVPPPRRSVVLDPGLCSVPWCESRGTAACTSRSHTIPARGISIWLARAEDGSILVVDQTTSPA